MNATDPCLCGRQDARGKTVAWSQCCGRYLDDSITAKAPDAETLMRSRYSAFVLLQRDYLLRTWHPDTRPNDLTFEPGVRWLGLQVRQAKRLDETHAEVEFVARVRDAGGRASRLHERSRFVLEQGGWTYVDGDQLS